ncbi:hypothetical protein QBC43DRAFT_112060 [Cladorrhinum sp. PSN259]|nr:hypothetical protein QBC43DRAFT_112060 [Cladorrhinum sp. PSN259]
MDPKPCTDSELIARTHKGLEEEAEDAGITLPSPTLPLPEFLSALKECSGVEIYSPAFGEFLSGETALTACHNFEKNNNFPLPVPCTAEQARAWLAVFPLDTLNFPSDPTTSASAASTNKYKLGDERSADLLVPLARWPKSNPERLEIARMLLENNGADPNGNTQIYRGWCYSPSDLGMAPIHIAAGTGDVEMVELLLEFGADKDKKDGYGRTAMDLAKAKGERAVVNVLEEWKGSHL